MNIEKKPFTCVRGGLTIRGTLFRRSGSDRLPGAIVSHEFMANERSVAKYARVLAEEGYAAFTYDFCGGCIVGRSDGRSRDMTVMTEVADLNAVMDAVQMHPDVAGGKLLLMGCSQGGFVSAITAALRRDDLPGFLDVVIASGESSWKLLQNLYVAGSDNQEMPLALEMSRRMLKGRGAWRIHGGGFAGTILAFVPFDLLDQYRAAMDGVFGEHATTVLAIRPEGVVRIG